MKYSKLRFAVAVVLVAGISKNATAQSSVTIYGKLDEGITYLNNNYGHPSYQMTSGILSTTVLGFHGVEDLEGGSSAIFNIEAPFDLGTGKSSSQGTYSGRTYVGLKNAFGSLTLGRQYDINKDFLTYLMPNMNDGYSGHVGDYDRMTGEKLNNVVKYISTSYHGLTIGGDYGFGNVAGSFGAKSAFSAGFQYANGPLTAAAVYTHENLPTIGGFAISPNADIGVSTFLGQDVTKLPYPVVDEQRTFGAGINYVIGKLTLAMVGSHTTFIGYGQKEILRVIDFGGNYYITPALSVSIGLQHDVMAESTWNQLGSGVDYFLSKETDLNLTADFQHAAGSGTLAAIDFVGARSTTQSQVAIRFGIRHLF